MIEPDIIIVPPVDIQQIPTMFNMEEAFPERSGEGNKQPVILPPAEQAINETSSPGIIGNLLNLEKASLERSILICKFPLLIYFIGNSNSLIITHFSWI